MDLPVMPPVKPVLAKSVEQMPQGMRCEPKWDGFRAIVFHDGDEVELDSRKRKPLTRYFPKIEEALKERLLERCVLDGEIVIAWEGQLDFDALTERLHPADSRMLGEKTPASFVSFDLLVGGQAAAGRAPSDRRALLTRALSGVMAPVHLEPVTTSGKKDVSWAPFRQERVAELGYERMESRARFWHTARFRRWRPDRTPESCTAIRPTAGDDDALRLRLRLDGG